jgi:hypothetical protein
MDSSLSGRIGHTITVFNVREEMSQSGPGISRFFRWRARRNTLCVKSIVVSVSILTIVLVSLTGTLKPAEASHTSIKFPFAAGTSWSILQGYNANPATGGTHYNCDPTTLRDTVNQSVSCSAAWQYKYSLDLYESSGNTAGLQVLAPANGTVRWMQASTGGISINLGDGYAIALFHVIVDPGLSAGSELRQGQVIGTVAPAHVAGAGNNPHIHFTLWETTDGGNWSRIARPFTGETTVDGVSFPDLGASSYNQHRGKTIYSSNQPLDATNIPAPPQAQAPASGATLNPGTSGVAFSWLPASGATEYQVVLHNVAYSPWTSSTSWTSGALPAGMYTWNVRSRNERGESGWNATRSFTVNSGAAATPAISLSTQRGPSGATITVSGSGFNSGEPIDIRWGTTTAAPFTYVIANAGGSFTTQVTLPDSTQGPHMIHVRGAQTGKIASSTYDVTPTLSRTPTEGEPGRIVAVTVKGFAANETVNLNWKSATGPSLGSVVTNANGTGSLSISIPNSGPGWTDYVGTGVTSRAVAYGAINVVSKVYIYPATASPGQVAHADAGGYPPNTAYNVAFNDVNSTGGSTVCSGTTGADGVIRCQFTVPQVSAGGYPISIRAGSVYLSGTLVVTGPPAVGVTPTERAVGVNVTVKAGGFAAGETVTFRWDNGSWQSAKTDTFGSVTILATVPPGVKGNHSVTARGEVSGRTATMIYAVGDGQNLSGSGMISPGVYSVFATREGLVGGTTSSGHVIVPNDYFVALPGCTPSNCKGGFTPGNMTQCGSKCYVKVINPITNVCRVEPILDTGPWFTVDDWWNPTDVRYLNNLASNPNTLAQGYPGAEAARNQLDVGYGRGPNGYGRDNTGTIPGRQFREVGNPAAIDLADGTWYALAPQGNAVGATITVEMLWQTGADPASSATACGHPLNQVPGQPFPPGATNPAFSGQKLPIVGSSDTPNTGRSGYAHDNNVSSKWYTEPTTPTSAVLRFDLGADKEVSGIKWKFDYTGYADSFTVRVINAEGGSRTFGPFGNATQANAFFGQSMDYYTAIRYVEFRFLNPRDHSSIGSVSEVEIWGSGYTVNPAGTFTPSFSGQALPIVNAADSPNTGRAGYAIDGNAGSKWYTASNTPSSALLRIDLGADKEISGVKWKFDFTGYADEFTVRIVHSSGASRTYGPFGNATQANTFFGQSMGVYTAIRYVEFNFSNPRGKPSIGSISEIEVWGSGITIYPPGTSNPGLSGQKLTIAGSSDTPETGRSVYTFDGKPETKWSSNATTPSTARFALDLGADREISGIRWKFDYVGYADEFTVRIVHSNGASRTYGPFGNATQANVFFGQSMEVYTAIRYVEFTFRNPRGMPAVGSVSEVEIWGSGITIYPAGTPNPSLGGSSLTIAASSDNPNTGRSGAAHDNNAGTKWYTNATTPASAQLRLDLGADREISGLKWKFDFVGYADEFTVRVVHSNGASRTYGPFGNATQANAYFGFSESTFTVVRYVEFNFRNPRSLASIGSVSEVQIWGSGYTAFGPGTRNPTMSGQKLPIFSSADTPISGRSGYAHDNNATSKWYTNPIAPATAQLRFDLGADRDINGIRWKFDYVGYADEFTVRIVHSSGVARTYGPFGNATQASTFFGQVESNHTVIRYVEFNFRNPRGQASIGSISEVEIWGETTTFAAAALSDPHLAGSPQHLTCTADPSNDSVGNACDENGGTNWHTDPTTPETATLTATLAGPTDLTGIKWVFAQQGNAERFNVSVGNGDVITSVGDFSGGAANLYEGIAFDEVVTADRVIVTFTNVDEDTELAYLAELEVWSEQQPAATPGASPDASPAASPAAGTPEPIETETPAGTPDTGTPAPIGTEAPAGTPAPVETEVPTATVEPSPTDAASPAPATEEPTGTVEPSETSEPTATTEPTPEPTAAIRVGTITGTGGDTVNCRVSAPDGDPITQLSEGDAVAVTGPAVDGWLPVICNGEAGFIAEEFVTLGEVTPTEPAEATETATVEPTTETTEEPEETPYPIADTGDTENSGTAWFASDDDASTSWSVYPNQNLEQARLYVDLGSVLPIDRITLELATWDQLPVFEIWLSEDGETWYNATPDGINGWNLERDVPLAIGLGYDARYLRIVIPNVDEHLGEGVEVGGIRQLDVWAGDINETQYLTSLGEPITPTPEPVEPTEDVIPTDVPTEDLIEEPTEDVMPTEEIAPTEEVVEPTIEDFPTEELPAEETVEAVG